ncbi:MAG: ABC transporter ATP-binding protein/permease [Patescibacteria group bacterium]|nr:ABC transporter ATP-binding protein/permease [Patescibacteria group bacterium]
MQVEQKKPARVWPVLRAYWTAVIAYPGLLILAITAAVTIEAGEVIAPLFLKQFVNVLAAGNTAPLIFGTLIAILGMYALVNFIAWIGQRVRMLTLGRLEARVMGDLYDRSFTYLVGHSHEFFISNFTGTLTRRVTRYARSFESVLDNFLINLLPAFIFLPGVVLVLSLRSVWLGAGLFVLTILFIYIQYKMVMWLQPLRTRRVEEDSRMTGALSDAVLNHSTITSFAALPSERSYFGKVTDQWRDATRKAMDGYALIYGVQGLFALFIEVAILAGAAFLWQKGLLTIGDFVLVQIYIINLLNRVWGVGRNMRQLHDAFSEATEMLDIMELPHEIVDAKSAKSLTVAEGTVAFDQVSFEYHDGHAVLNDFSLTIESHEKVALIGSSGAGKTTIAKLLIRLYDLKIGSISIDGQNIAKVTQESLRRAIAFVPQEPMLFHRSLMENIRYGRQEATDEEVIEAAKQAHCFEFISRYPEGFNTMVGERGVKLSGGERQRVAIARAILKNAPILVLDEATSSLDSESERLIQDALLRLMEGKTVIAIAHRLSTVMHMNRLIVMEKGSVVLTGTHEELLAEEGNLYKKLWEIQAGGFLRKD